MECLGRLIFKSQKNGKISYKLKEKKTWSRTKNKEARIKDQGNRK